jgi:NADH-quinone oxidoreductase subunit L
MRLTFIVFLIAAASLSGIPPFSGFWSKDSVLASAWSAGQWGLFAVGAVTAGITAFYTFRMVGLIFYGKGGDHDGEHQPHETGPLGWIPYAILGGMTLVIGLLAYPLNIYGALEQAATTYLQGLYPKAAIPAVPSGFSFDAESAGIALVFVAMGVGVAYMMYLARRVDPQSVVGKTGFMHGLYTFLENRWYINALYYRVFVDPLLSISGWLLDGFELRGLERVNSGTAALWVYISRAGNWVDGNVVDKVAADVAVDGESLSRALRRIQTGVLERYTLIFAIGLAVVLLLFVLSTGVLG